MMKQKINLYEDHNGEVYIEARVLNGAIWMTQKEMSDLFQRDRSVISRHIRNIFSDGELRETYNIQKSHIGGSPNLVNVYSLDVIISVGFRVKSKQAIKFRRWAIKRLREDIVKGLKMNADDQRRKAGVSYFNELLTYIREFQREI